MREELETLRAASLEEPLLRDVLSSEAKELLLAATEDDQGVIIHSRTMGGLTIQVKRKNYCEKTDRRSQARWEAGLEELITHDLIKDMGHKNEVFQVTARGFAVADELKQVTAETWGTPNVGP